MIDSTLSIVIWPLNRIKPYAKNARKIPQAAIEKVAKSLAEFGWRQPLVVDPDGVLIVGHVRRLAAIFLGWTEAPVHVAADLTPDQIRQYRLMDNRSHDEATWDLEVLTLEMKELSQMDLSLELTGFSPDQLADIQFPKQDEKEPDDVPAAPAVAVSRPGDVWKLGRHRLMCGDSTSLTDVGLLMAGERAHLSFTDPPYNVDYEGYTEEKLQIKSDKMSPAAFALFLGKSFQSLRFAVRDTASLYVCHSSSCQIAFQQAMETAGFEVRCQIIWAKNTFAWGFGRYKFQHEPIFYAHVAGEADPWYGDKTQSTLWPLKKPSASRLHPTTKPLELVDRALQNSSRAGDLVVDLFGGSGSTLIACERRGRDARLMELDPKYCDVIIQRWQNAANAEARLGDLPFSAIAETRKAAPLPEAAASV